MSDPISRVGKVQTVRPASREAGWSREATVAVVVTLLVLLVRFWYGWHVSFCGTPDSCAYLALGESLSHHHGFLQNFLYQYQFVSLHVPTNGMEYWRPGVSLLLLLTQPFGGVTLHSSLIVTALAGVVTALAAWRIASNFTDNRGVACASFLLCLVLPPFWSGSISPDSSLYYGAFAAWFLALFSVRFRGYRSDIAALFCIVGLNFIRNDAILLLVPMAVVLWLRRRSGEPRGTSMPYVVLLVAGFFAATLPLDILNYAVTGKLFPGGASQVLYLTNLSELTSYGNPAPDIHSMLAFGISGLVKLRVVTLPLILYRALFLYIGFAIVFLAGLALRRGTRTTEELPLPEFAGGLSFALTLLGVYGLVLPAIGGFSALRSFTGLLPLAAVLIVVGIYRATDSSTMARGLVSAVILFYLTTGTMEDRREQAGLNQTGDQDRLVATYLSAHGGMAARSLIMTNDAAQFSQTTGYAAVPVPNNGLPAIQKAIQDFRPSYVLLNTEGMPGSETVVQSMLQPAGMARIPGTTVLVLTMGLSGLSRP
jgi:hypothetical protein